MNSKGFSLVELLIVMSVLIILSSFAAINLLKPQSQSGINAAATELSADIKSQQIKAMDGDNDGSGGASSYGIYFQNTSYTLFKGSAYSAADPNNFEVTLDNGVTITGINLPGSVLVFDRRSGEVSGFSAGHSSVEILNPASGEQKVITVNKYGAITQN